MKVYIPEQNKQELPPKAANGARVGDKVIFSSHNPKNIEDKDSLSRWGYQLNKIYVVVGVECGDTTLVNDDGKEYYAGNTTGEFDIIERAPLPEPTPAEFQPITLTLETQGDADLIRAYMRATDTRLCNHFGVSRFSLDNVHIALNNVHKLNSPLVDIQLK